MRLSRCIVVFVCGVLHYLRTDESLEVTFAFVCQNVDISHRGENRTNEFEYEKCQCVRVCVISAYHTYIHICKGNRIQANACRFVLFDRMNCTDSSSQSGHHYKLYVCYNITCTHDQWSSTMIKFCIIFESSALPKNQRIWHKPSGCEITWISHLIF